MSTHQVINPEYFTLPNLAQFSGLGLRLLRDATKSHDHPLPHYRVGHKTIIVARNEFREWLKKFKVDRENEVDRVVGLALAGVKK